jgi:peptidoglycan/LPS O-acetylase OafA/YrhL
MPLSASRHARPSGHGRLDVVLPATGRERMRLGELDSLRGLAALAVSFAHIVGQPLGVAAAVIAVISLTPLHAFYAGEHAVLFFFVLSGFVLALPFFRGDVSPTAFVVKRAVRLYPVYLAVIAASIAAYSILLGDPHVDWATGLSYASMVSANTPGIDGVVWSLAHEMRLSIVFPILMIPIVKLPSRWILVTSLGLVAAGFWMGDTPRSVLPIATVYYAFFFVLGAVVAKHVDRLVAFVRTLDLRRAALALVIAFGVYGAMPFTGPGLPIQEAVVGIAVAGIMLLALGRPAISRFLMQPALRFLGRISYSYYLLHSVVLTHVADALYGRLPNVVIVVIGIGGSVVLAWAAYRWIETPSIHLGQHLYRRISERMGERSLPRTVRSLRPALPSS